MKVGEIVTKWKPGDRVAINPQINCEECVQCKKGLPHLCDHSLLIGSSMRGFLDGAMCEYLVMHEKQLYHLPDEEVMIMERFLILSAMQYIL